MPDTIVFKRFVRPRVEIYGIVSFAVAVSPSAPFGRALHPSAYGVVVHTFHTLAGGGASYTACKVNLDARTIAFRECETHHAPVGCGREFGRDVVIGEMYSVISGRGFLALFVVTRSVSGVGPVFSAAVSVEFAGGGHYKKIA